MSAENESYLRLITSEYANAPRFCAYVEVFLNMINPIWDCLESFDTIFNIDTAVGDQLDQWGVYYDISRELPITDPNIPSILPDDLYRLVLKARRIANHWKGSYQGLVELVKELYPNVDFELLDNQDMTMTFTLVNPDISDAETALILNGYIIPKPEGVGINLKFQEGELFGWDTDAMYIKGWDLANWRNY